jgi:hypothetical protein
MEIFENIGFNEINIRYRIEKNVKKSSEINGIGNSINV